MAQNNPIKHCVNTAAIIETLNDFNSFILAHIIQILNKKIMEFKLLLEPHPWIYVIILQRNITVWCTLTTERPISDHIILNIFTELNNLRTYGNANFKTLFSIPWIFHKLCDTNCHLDPCSKHYKNDLLCLSISCFSHTSKNYAVAVNIILYNTIKSKTTYSDSDSLVFSSADDFNGLLLNEAKLEAAVETVAVESGAEENLKLENAALLASPDVVFIWVAKENDEVVEFKPPNLNPFSPNEPDPA